jgi:hypothetical protein
VGPCIRLVLKDGLGNQLFQYAAGRALALRCDLPLFVDARNYSPASPDRAYARGDYVLSHFGIDASPADWRIRLHQAGRMGRRLLRLVDRHSAPVFRNDAVCFDVRFDDLQGPVVLDGYFQSCKYFRDCAGTIRADLEPALLRYAPESLRGLLGAEGSVAIHVRRGDYLKSGLFNDLWHEGYYVEAVAQIKRRVRQPRFYFFSDDPAWLRHQLAASGFHGEIISGQDSDPLRELAAFACAPNCIIANSSFSWWGAWLGAGSAKTVIAPRRWLRRWDVAHDVIPPEWESV